MRGEVDGKCGAGLVAQTQRNFAVQCAHARASAERCIEEARRAANLIDVRTLGASRRRPTQRDIGKVQFEAALRGARERFGREIHRRRQVLAQRNGEFARIDLHRCVHAIVVARLKATAGGEGASVQASQRAVDIEAHQLGVTADAVFRIEGKFDALVCLADAERTRSDFKVVVLAALIVRVVGSLGGAGGDEIDHALGSGGEQFAQERRFNAASGDGGIERRGGGCCGRCRCGGRRRFRRRRKRAAQRPTQTQDSISEVAFEEAKLKAVGANAACADGESSSDAFRAHASAVEVELDGLGRE